MSELQVNIVSAEGEIFAGNATMVVAPAELGEVGITPRHAPLLTRLKPGEVRVQTGEGEERFFFVSGGILEVQPNHVTVLADTAVRAKDIDEAAAVEAQKRAEEAMANAESAVDLAKAQAEIAAAAAQLRALARLRKQLKR